MPNIAEAGLGGLLQEGAQARILRFLWRSRGEWSGREVARRVGLSAPACHEEIKRLDARGLVLLRRVSNVHLYAANPESELLKTVLVPLFEAQDAMPGRIEALVRACLADAHGLLSVTVFGSAARGTAREGSDLDVLVVVAGAADAKALRPRLEELRGRLFRGFHLPLSPYVQTVSELRRKRGLPLIRGILKDGRTIHGKQPKELLA